MAKKKSVMLAPNVLVPFESEKLTYPLYLSIKYDGNRMLLRGDEFVTRSLKPQPNKNLPGHFSKVLEFCKEHGFVLDGELYDHTLTFSELQSIVRSHEKPLPDTTKFYVFDMLTMNEWLNGNDEPFSQRCERYRTLFEKGDYPNVVPVEQVKVNNANEARQIYGNAIEEGHEGVIARDPHGWYKHGRATINQGLVFKFKEIKTLDGKIIGIEKRKKMRDGLDRTYDAKGHLERSFKKEDYYEIDAIGSFWVEDDDGRQFKIGWGKGFDFAERDKLWEQRDELIGKYVEFKCMDAGEKDVPRMGLLVRFRPDKDKDED